MEIRVQFERTLSAFSCEPFASQEFKRGFRKGCFALSWLILVAVVLGFDAPSAAAQMESHPNVSGLPRADVSRSGDVDDPFRNNPELRERLQRARAVERQKRIVDDANRLVELTVQYCKAVDAHGTATADDQKLLSLIEKLAHDVKDRMRGM